MRIFQMNIAASRILGLSLVTFAGFFLLGYGGIYVWADKHSLSPIWPATALGFVMMLRLPKGRAEDLAMLAAMLAAGLAANLLGGSSLLGASLFSAINVLDVLAGVLAVRRIGMPASAICVRRRASWRSRDCRRRCSARCWPPG